MENIVENFKVSGVIPPKRQEGSFFHYEDSTNLCWTGIEVNFEEPEKIKKIEVIIEVKNNNDKNKRLF